MAKSRADGTPAKAGRKASPAKTTKASPAKPAKSKAATPERTTRSSPRRTVPSAKAQEAAADHVQTGRVVKKASPSKPTTPAKKVSPKKAVKATSAWTPAKEASPEKATSIKKSPSKTTTPTKTKQTVKATNLWTPAKKATSPEDYREFVRQFEDSSGSIPHDFARYAIRHGIIQHLETDDAFDQMTIIRCYRMLLHHKVELDGNARATDDDLTRQLRPMYRKIKKNMRGLLGPGLDECLKDSVSTDVFGTALRVGLEDQGFLDSNGLIPRNVDIPRASMPAIRVTAEILERVKRVQDRAVQRKAERVAEQEASGLSHEEYRDQVLSGRVAKPASRAASRSRSPAKSPTKREREASVSRPVRARSQSPKKAAPRTASKSPAPVGRPTTRSRSPAKAADTQPASTGRQSRSKSPAKASTRQASKSPAPAETIKIRARSPAKAKEAFPAPLKVAKTRSKSPAKADASQTTAAGRTRGTSKSPARKDSLYQPTGDDDEDEPAPQTKKTPKKSPIKGAASLSNKSPSPSTRVRSASPAKATSAPTAPRARSRSPHKPARPPHPNELGRGAIISPTNPQTIASLNKPNPFHETLPAPEIWHRRMPPYFPFGETPFMEREISRQIEEDLARGLEESRATQQKNNGILKRVASFATGAADVVMSTFSPAKPRVKYPSAWDLPDVSEAEVRALFPPRQSSIKDRAKSAKATCSGTLESSEEEEESDDSEHYMSGGLH